jgi:hypothetical protein
LIIETLFLLVIDLALSFRFEHFRREEEGQHTPNRQKVIDRLVVCIREWGGWGGRRTRHDERLIEVMGKGGTDGGEGLFKGSV